MTRRSLHLLRLVLLICFLLHSVPGLELMAAEVNAPRVAVPVEAEIASIRLRINAGDVDGKRALYPLLNYKQITYIPLTWNLCQSLGLESAYSSAYGSLSVRPNSSIALNPLKQDLLPAAEPDQIAGAKVQATTVTYTVYIGGTEIDNATQEWPLLSYKDVTYLPLTWQFAHDLLKIDYEFQSTGDKTLSLVRSLAYSGVPEKQLSQILLSARTKLSSMSLTSTRSVIVADKTTEQTISRFDPLQKTVWQSSYGYLVPKHQHLLSITLPTSPVTSAVNTTYNTPGATPGATTTAYAPATSTGTAYGATTTVYGITATAYGATATTYNPPEATVTGSIYGATDAVYGSEEIISVVTDEAYGVTAAAYGATELTYGDVREIDNLTDKVYGVVEAAYGATNSAYGSTNAVYGASEKAYGAIDKVYGATGTVYGSDMESSTTSAYSPVTPPGTSTPPAQISSQVYLSVDGNNWQKVDSVAYSTYLLSPPTLPTFELNYPVGGWPIQCEDGEWFFELEHMTLEMAEDGSGLINLFTYRFDMSNWTLKRVTQQEIPLIQGQLAPSPNAAVTITEIEYVEITDMPKP